MCGLRPSPQESDSTTTVFCDEGVPMGKDAKLMAAKPRVSQDEVHCGDRLVEPGIDFPRGTLWEWLAVAGAGTEVQGDG